MDFLAFDADLDYDKHTNTVYCSRCRARRPAQDSCSACGNIFVGGEYELEDITEALGGGKDPETMTGRDLAGLKGKALNKNESAFFTGMSYDDLENAETSRLAEEAAEEADRAGDIIQSWHIFRKQSHSSNWAAFEFIVLAQIKAFCRLERMSLTETNEFVEEVQPLLDSYVAFAFEHTPLDRAFAGSAELTSKRYRKVRHFFIKYPFLISDRAFYGHKMSEEFRREAETKQRDRFVAKEAKQEKKEKKKAEKKKSFWKVEVDPEVLREKEAAKAAKKIQKEADAELTRKAKAARKQELRDKSGNILESLFSSADEAESEAVDRSAQKKSKRKKSKSAGGEFMLIDMNETRDEAINRLFATFEAPDVPSDEEQEGGGNAVDKTRGPRASESSEETMAKKLKQMFGFIAGAASSSSTTPSQEDQAGVLPPTPSIHDMVRDNEHEEAEAEAAGEPRKSSQSDREELEFEQAIHQLKNVAPGKFSAEQELVLRPHLENTVAVLYLILRNTMPEKQIYFSALYRQCILEQIPFHSALAQVPRATLLTCISSYFSHSKNSQFGPLPLQEMWNRTLVLSSLDGSPLSLPSPFLSSPSSSSISNLSRWTEDIALRAQFPHSIVSIATKSAQQLVSHINSFNSAPFPSAASSSSSSSSSSSFFASTNRTRFLKSCERLPLESVLSALLFISLKAILGTHDQQLLIPLYSLPRESFAYADWPGWIGWRLFCARHYVTNSNSGGDLSDLFQGVTLTPFASKLIGLSEPFNQNDEADQQELKSILFRHFLFDDWNPSYPSSDPLITKTKKRSPLLLQHPFMDDVWKNFMFISESLPLDAWPRKKPVRGHTSHFITGLLMADAAFALAPSYSSSPSPAAAAAAIQQQDRDDSIDWDSIPSHGMGRQSHRKGKLSGVPTFKIGDVLGSESVSSTLFLPYTNSFAHAEAGTAGAGAPSSHAVAREESLLRSLCKASRSSYAAVKDLVLELEAILLNPKKRMLKEEQLDETVRFLPQHRDSHYSLPSSSSSSSSAMTPAVRVSGVEHDSSIFSITPQQQTQRRDRIQKAASLVTIPTQVDRYLLDFNYLYICELFTSMVLYQRKHLDWNRFKPSSLISASSSSSAPSSSPPPLLVPMGRKAVTTMHSLAGIFLWTKSNASRFGSVSNALNSKKSYIEQAIYDMYVHCVFKSICPNSLLCSNIFNRTIRCAPTRILRAIHLLAIEQLPIGQEIPLKLLLAARDALSSIYHAGLPLDTSEPLPYSSSDYIAQRVAHAEARLTRDLQHSNRDWSLFSLLKKSSRAEDLKLGAAIPFVEEQRKEQRQSVLAAVMVEAMQIEPKQDRIIKSEVGLEEADSGQQQQPSAGMSQVDEIAETVASSSSSSFPPPPGGDKSSSESSDSHIVALQELESELIARNGYLEEDQIRSFRNRLHFILKTSHPNRFQLLCQYLLHKLSSQNLIHDERVDAIFQSSSCESELAAAYFVHAELSRNFKEAEIILSMRFFELVRIHGVDKRLISIFCGRVGWDLAYRMQLAETISHFIAQQTGERRWPPPPPPPHITYEHQVDGESPSPLAASASPLPLDASPVDLCTSSASLAFVSGARFDGDGKLLPVVRNNLDNRARERLKGQRKRQQKQQQQQQLAEEAAAAAAAAADSQAEADGVKLKKPKVEFQEAPQQQQQASAPMEALFRNPLPQNAAVFDYLKMIFAEQKQIVGAKR